MRDAEKYPRAVTMVEKGNNRIFGLYLALLFFIGFGWFMIAPIIPDLTRILHTSPSDLLVIISAYGYTMVVFGLLAGYLSFKGKVGNSVLASAVLTVIGLGLRPVLQGYIPFLLLSILAAIGYPLAMAPVGSIAEVFGGSRSHSLIGFSVGSLFLGMAIGALLTPYMIIVLPLDAVLEIPAIAAFIIAIMFLIFKGKFPSYYSPRKFKGLFKIGMLKNWYVGLTISAMSVMFGSIASSVLILHGFKVSTALEAGGLFGGLAFLGSAVGAMVLPPLFGRNQNLKYGLVSTGSMAFVFGFSMMISLEFSRSLYLIGILFFLFGFFGNAYWSMAMTSVTYYSPKPEDAGFSTAMFSVATNIGVAVIPVFLGSLFVSPGHIFLGMIVVSLLLLFSGLVSYFLLYSPKRS
ncbi:MFS transporter [Thermoplasma sp.]|uniref:MFS transporter n=1 Tax=Thermoplasma sp. TaxID=1973142 RepID=UPI0026080A20|nr:MFS transporter [Thermoplasma sp.]